MISPCITLINKFSQICKNKTPVKIYRFSVLVLCLLQVLAKLANAKEEVDVDDKTTKAMTVPAGVPLAYSVYELAVDVSDGTFQIVVDREKRGGFCGEDTVDAVEADDILGEEDGLALPLGRNFLLKSFVLKKIILIYAKIL